jgi:FkbM family methyltransferase
MSTAPIAVELLESDATHVPDSSLVRTARRIPGAAAVLDRRSVRHAAAARRLGSLVRESVGFAGADLLGLGGVRRYHLRASGRPVLLRHGTIDVWTFYEIFARRLYEPPPALARALGRMPSPVVLDLGANIGMFGLDALARNPGARVIAYEPDARNAIIHRRLIELNDVGDRWRLVEACAGATEGSVAFLSGHETASRIVPAGSPGSIEVPMEDVLPLVATADLVKMDIEGGEWPILEDPRFAAVGAVVLEYHPVGAAGDEPARAAIELLRDYGLAVSTVFHDPAGIGMLWATRD